MRLLVTTDAHIMKAPDGSYWNKNIYRYSFWTRYMNVFDTVRIASRVKYVQDIDPNWKRVDGDHIEIFEIPFFQGPVQLLKGYGGIRKVLRKAYEDCDAVLYRMPSPTGQLLWNTGKKLSIPKALEVVYDPIDELKDKNSNFIFKAVARYNINALKGQCLSANGVSYVTEHSIQDHFPSYARCYGEDKEHFESYYSTITLDADAFGTARDYSGNKYFIFVLSDVAMNSDRKGEKVLLHVIKELRDQQIDCRAIIIGDGSKRQEFEQLAIELGIKTWVHFTGLLGSPDEVRHFLTEGDMFVFPTLAEGLPRGILEAMALGMVVVSSPVGGIPEIIDKDYLVSPEDPHSYTEIIKKLISNRELMNRVSQKNYEKSLEFRNELLQRKRDEFYQKLAGLVRR